jgi:hypothetical protein
LGYNPFPPNYTPKRKPNLLIKSMDQEVSPSGGMHWRMKFRFNAKENICSMGAYPETLLVQAPQRYSLSNFKMKRLFNLRHKKSRIVGCG